MDPQQPDTCSVEDQDRLAITKAQHRLLLAFLAARGAHYSTWGLVASKKPDAKVNPMISVGEYRC